MRHDPVKKYIFLNLRSIEETTACLELDGVLYVSNFIAEVDIIKLFDIFHYSRKEKAFVLEDLRTMELFKK